MDLVKTSPRDPLNSEISISELGLSTRAVNALMSVGLDTLEKVSSKTYEELLKIPRIGQVTAAEITRKVHRTLLVLR
jgi:DNA-directed RNA polymerase alpha subunit